MSLKTGKIFRKDKSSVLDKKVPRNQKYEYCAPQVDSGFNVLKVEPKVDRSGEIFRRVNPAVLMQLLVEDDEQDESIYNLKSSHDEDQGAINVVHPEESSQKERDFLLVDLRDSEAFAKCHIKSAYNWEHVNLSRDRISPLLFRYKNKDDKFIILYEDGDFMGAKTASQFVEKGWENALLLTGGIQSFGRKYLGLMSGEFEALPEFERISTTAGRRLSTGRSCTGNRTARGRKPASRLMR